jgi:putative ABC transport system permease protein
MNLVYLFARYLWFYRHKIMILSLSISLVIAIPLGLNLFSKRLRAHLKLRAESTPLILGSKGSALDLSLSTLYYTDQPLPNIKYKTVDEVLKTGYAQAIAVYRKYRVKDFPIVGTTADYFNFRSLKIFKGRHFLRIGECVLGYEAAKKMGVTIGETIISTPENVFNIAGSYPLKMDVVGILFPSGSADDHGVFVDIKTSWIIEGLSHGHQDLEKEPDAILSKEGETLVANASLKNYNYVTEKNMDQFHFHGNIKNFPINAIIVLPHDHKSKTILLGHYMDDHPFLMLITPILVIEKVLQTVFDIKNLALGVLLILVLATFAIASFVFKLSLKLRTNEIETISNIGASKASVAFLLFSEIIAVLFFSMILILLMVFLVSMFGDQLIYYFI